MHKSTNKLNEFAYSFKQKSEAFIKRWPNEKEWICLITLDLVLMKGFLRLKEIAMLELVHCVKPNSLQWKNPEDTPFTNPSLIL